MEDKWRNAVMTMGMRDRIMKEDGREEGLERGHKEEKRENIRMTYRFYVNQRRPKEQTISELAQIYGMSIREIEDVLAEPANRVDAWTMDRKMRDRIMREEGREEGREERTQETIRMTYTFYVNQRRPKEQTISELAQIYGMSIREIEDVLAEPANRVDA